MKKLNLIQKIGLVSAIVGGLTLGGCTIKNNSGLESKIPTVGTSIANAMEVNTQGYEVPDLAGRTPNSAGYDEDSEGIKYKFEYFLNMYNKNIVRLSRNGNIFAYVIDQNNDGKMDYVIQDNDGDGKFESKYGSREPAEIPKWVR